MRCSWRKNYKLILLSAAIGYLLAMAPLALQAQSSVLELNEDIQGRRKQQQQLQQKIAEYQNKIRTTQRRAATLANQITILDSNIAKTGLEIKTKELEAEQLILEVELAERQIRQEEMRIDATLTDIAHALREVRKLDEQRYLEIILAGDTFSEAFDYLFYSERLTSSLKKKLDTLKRVRALLQGNRELLQEKHQEAEEKRDELDILKGSFTQEKRVKQALFGKTKTTEGEFQALLKELREAAAAIDSEIVTLEKKIRDRLDLADKLAGEAGLLSWPLTPIGGVSARFHDPDYPFRYLFEHTGMDIRTPQGTPARAAASGYVAKAYNSGLGVRPSYVMLIHGNNLSTVYMHLSSISVAPDTFVARGDIIGYSGGAPKTAGAGRWSTGPHLHFETRFNGVPVDPLGYLP